MTKNKITLPKTYNNENGKYPQYVGYPKLSYSQYTSWIDPEYKLDYIRRYFLGAPFDSNIWSDYGSEVGNYIEITATTKDYSEFTPVMLSEEDKEILNGLDYPENSTYEDEIVLPVKDKQGNIVFVIQGFIDEATYTDEGKSVSILDFKTGNVDKKVEFYSSEDYGQTTLYAHCKEIEGLKITGSSVLLLGRKGNGFPKYPVKLSGVKESIDTPYSQARAKILVKKMTEAAEEISKAYQVFLKINK